MRDFARWLGEMLSGQDRSLRSVLVRCGLMLTAGSGLTWLAVRLAFEDDRGGRGRLWQGLLALAMALGIRVLFELYELDAALSGSAFVAAVFGALAVAVAQNVGQSPELATRGWVFAGLACIALMIAVQRLVTCARRGD